MKLCHLVYIVWCLLRRAQGVYQEDKLRESDNTLIEGLALENLELGQDADNKVDSYVEMLSDFEDAINEEYFKDHEVDGLLRVMSHNEFEGQDQRVADPFWKDPSPRSSRSPRDGHTYCGPYKYHYTEAQDCLAVGLHYHADHSNKLITVKECEDLCKNQYRCNAFNWGPKPHIGCVLIECGFSNTHFPPTPFPMPVGLNPDWLSFSKYKPNETPACQHPGYPAQGASYDTPNKYCGPYDKVWGPGHKLCSWIPPVIYNALPLQCESKCDGKLECTGFNYNPSAKECTLVSCRGQVQPVPTDLDIPFLGTRVWTKSYSKDPLPGKTVDNCYTDGRRSYN